MDEIFRFLLHRPPAPAKPISVKPSAAFAAELATANAAPDRKAALKAKAASFVRSGRGVTKLVDLAMGAPLLATLDALPKLGELTGPKVAGAVVEAFRKPFAQVVGTPEFVADRERLSDNLLAAKLLSRDDAVEARRFEALLRLMTLMERIAANDPSLKEPNEVSLALERPTLIGNVVAAPVRDRPTERPPESPPPNREKEELRKRLDALAGLAGALEAVDPDSFDVPTSEAPPAPAAPEPDPMGRVRDMLLRRAGEITPDQLETGTFSRLRTELQALSSTRAETGQALPGAARLVLTSAAGTRLNEAHHATLRSLSLDLTTSPVPFALEKVTNEASALHSKLAKLESKKLSYTLVGSELQNVLDITKYFPPVPLGGNPSVPLTHGSIKPVGVGDLLVVRQTLKQYQGGEVGHIENILKGEFKKREHLRKRETETTITVEEESKKEEERDSQTTERFEMKREAAQIVKEDSSFKAGLSISGSYGPTVEFKASTDFAMNNAKEESARTATNYSKEMTNRALSRISERRREERIMRTLEVFEERNEHGVDNARGTDHTVGVYQWVDKVYEAQVFNYGRRMMFDVMVPEPAAFWLFANSRKTKPGASIERPERFELTPDQLTAWNYYGYVQQYEVAGVKPPPEFYKTVSKTFEGANTHEAQGGTKVAELPIPDGYQAVGGYVLATGNVWADMAASWAFQVSIGKVYWGRTPTTGFVNHFFKMNKEQTSVAVGINSFGHGNWIATIEIDCTRTDRAFNAWKLETHAAIMQGYLKLERDYQEALAAAQVQAANQIQGRNPVENRSIERTELKKQAISLLTAQHFEMFGAITYSFLENYPQPLLGEAELEGRYIRFFEQAFEWEHMTYVFYPYFWGRKGNWPARALLQDVDAQFAEFLKAGSARLVFPVRPGFEAALAHFMDTGEIWEGADPPTLTSPLYVNIIDEIKERTQAPGSEIAQGDPWDVKLPTTLVKLRADNALPSWKKKPDGTWVEN